MDYAIHYYGYLAHHGIKGQKWGIRRFENPDGTLTAMGKMRYGKVAGRLYTKTADHKLGRMVFADPTRAGQGMVYRDIRRDVKRDLKEQNKELTKENIDAGMKDFYKKRYGKNADLMYKMHRNSNIRATRKVAGNIASIAALPLGVVGGGIGMGVGGALGTAVPGIGNAAGADMGFDIGWDIATAPAQYVGMYVARKVGAKLGYGDLSYYKLYGEWKDLSSQAVEKVRNKELKDLY